MADWFAAFFGSAQVDHALVIGGIAALLSALAGLPTMMRGQSFAGHALSDVGGVGGAAALLFGMSPLTGFLGATLIGGLAMEGVTLRRASERELLAGIVLGVSLGLSALVLSLLMIHGSQGGAPVTILFGSIFLLPPGIAGPSIVVGLVALILSILFARQVLLVTLDPDLARVRGIRTIWPRVAFLVTLAMAVAISALTVGAILSTALLVGPAATAFRMTRRPARALLLSAGLGLFAVWGGVLMAYASYDWTGGHAWPASFCIVALVWVPHVVLPWGWSLMGRENGTGGPGRERACSPTT